MRKCKECRYFISNLYNSDGRCEKEKEDVASERVCCDRFKMRLTEKEMYIREFSKKKKIDEKEYKEYTGLKKQVFEELIENRCLAGDPGNLTYCYVQENEFEAKYYDILY